MKDFDKLLNFDIDEEGNYLFYGINKSKAYLVFYSAKTKKMPTLLTEVNLLDIRLFNGVVYYAVNDDAKTYLVSYNTTSDTLLSLGRCSSFKFLDMDSASITFSTNVTGLNQVYHYDLGSTHRNALPAFTLHASPIPSSRR